jgi:hypothetical protein
MTISAKIKDINMQGLVRVLFSDEMLIPDSIYDIDQNILKLTLIKGDEDSQVNLTGWNLTFY